MNLCAIAALAAVLPASLLVEIRRDLRNWDARDCLSQSDEALLQSLRVSPLGPRDAWIVEGLGPCFSGANNGAKLIYVKAQGKWRKVLDANGNRLATSRGRSHGLPDVILQRHGSAYESEEYLYRYDGAAYQPSKCAYILYADIATGRPFRRARRSPCATNWREELQP